LERKMKTKKHLDQSSKHSVTSVSEKALYGLGGVGYQMTIALSGAFLTLYYTDSVLMSASFVGTMMLVARFLDGISDLIMGFVIEKTKTRFGKARPWVMIGAIPLALSMIFVFNVPASLPPLSKNAYVFLTYVFMSVVCYTIVALAHNAMLPRISLVSSDRNVAAVVLVLMQGIMTAVLVGVFAPLLKAFGGESSQNAWTIISIMIAVVSLLLLTLCFIGTKEKLSATEQAAETTTEAPKEGAQTGRDTSPKDASLESTKGKRTRSKDTSIKRALSFLLKSRYFYIIIALYLMLAITSGTAGIGIYFVRDVLGNADLLGLFSIAAAVPMIIMMPLVPKLFATLGKRKTFLTSQAASILIRIVMLLFPTSLPVQLVCTFLGTLVLVPLWAGTPTMICDLVDYGDYKYGIRSEGLTTSASSIGSKLGTGLGSVILGIGLTMGGYNALASVQSQTTINAIIFIMNGIPAIMCALCLVLIGLWNLEKFRPEVEQYMKCKQEEVEMPQG
jgi:GPH family glycoside/pentoside/hexuronide:cation symporter